MVYAGNFLFLIRHICDDVPLSHSYFTFVVTFLHRQTDRQGDSQTQREADRQMDGRTDGRTEPATYLEYIESTEFDPTPLLRAVHLCALDDDSVGGQVDTPRQGRRRHQHLDVTVSEQVLHQGTVHSVTDHGPSDTGHNREQTHS